MTDRYTGGLPEPPLLALKIEDLGFSGQVRGLLTTNVGDTIADLLKFNPKELRDIYGIGAKTSQTVIDKMSELGFTEWATAYATWIKTIIPDTTCQLMEKYKDVPAIDPLNLILKINQLNLPQWTVIHLEREYECFMIGELLQLNPDDLYSRLGYKSVQVLLNEMCKLGFVKWAASYQAWAAAYETWIKAMTAKAAKKLATKYKDKETTPIPVSRLLASRIWRLRLSKNTTNYLKQCNCKSVRNVLEIGPDKLYRDAGYVYALEVINRMCELGFFSWAATCETWQSLSNAS